MSFPALSQITWFRPLKTPPRRPRTFFCDFLRLLATPRDFSQTSRGGSRLRVDPARAATGERTPFSVLFLVSPFGTSFRYLFSVFSRDFRGPRGLSPAVRGYGDRRFLPQTPLSRGDRLYLRPRRDARAPARSLARRRDGARAFDRDAAHPRLVCELHPCPPGGGFRTWLRIAHFPGRPGRPEPLLPPREFPPGQSPFPARPW